MAFRSRRGRAPIGRGQRQPTTWARLVQATDYQVVAAGTKVLLVTAVLSNPGISETIRRTRGLVSICSDQSVALEVQFGALGAMVVSDLAVAAGVASIPGPVTDANDDGWFVWQPVQQLQMGDVGGALSASRSVQYEFDSKAMRRVQEGFAMAFVFENNGAHGVNVALAASLLTSLS